MNKVNDYFNILYILYIFNNRITFYNISDYIVSHYNENQIANVLIIYLKLVILSENIISSI